MATLSFVYSRDRDPAQDELVAGGQEQRAQTAAAAATTTATASTASASHSQRHTGSPLSPSGSPVQRSPRAESGKLPSITPPSTAPAFLSSSATGLGSTSATSAFARTTRNAARQPFLRTLDEALRTQELVDAARQSAQQRIREVRHIQYSCPQYGSPQLRAEYKREHRQSLLATIYSKEQHRRLAEELRREENRGVLASDAAFLAQTATLSRDHSMALHAFRDGNKVLMEAREQQRRAEREQQARYERQLLQHDPVNWSKTLT